MINLIWAMDKNWLIGIDDKLPWHYKEDLAYFKELTHNKTVLMGEKTYLSLKNVYYKNRKLPFDVVYVASQNSDLLLSDAIKISDVESFLNDFTEELWVLGGATIYNLALKYADRLYITWIFKEYEGNRYFPKFNIEAEFKLLEEQIGFTKELKFSIYGRIKK